MVACGPTRRGLRCASSAVGLLLFALMGCREEPPFSIGQPRRALPEPSITARTEPPAEPMKARLEERRALDAELPAPMLRVDFRRRDCSDSKRDLYFFPAGVLGTISVYNYDEDADVRKGLSGVFRRVTEPTLSCAGFEGEGYRFYSSVTFRGSRIIRVSIPTPGALGTVIVVASTKTTKRPLSEEEQGAFSMAIVRADFWQLSTHGRRGPGHEPEGGSWVIEGRRGGVYQIVNRWESRSGPVRELVEHFRRLARLPPVE